MAHRQRSVSEERPKDSMSLTQACLKARLVELDLLEQFLNRHNTRGISRLSLYEYKMSRLKDLTGRLDTELEAIGNAYAPVSPPELREGGDE